MRWRTFAVGAALAANAVLSCTCESKAPSTGAPADAGALEVASGPEAAADVGAADGSLCDRICAIRASLGCPRMLGDCAGACRGAIEGACAAPWTAYFNCAAERPATDYLCTDRGQPDLKSGVCTAEHDAVERCLMGR